MIKVETKLNAETAKKLNKRGLKNLTWVIVLFVALFLFLGIAELIADDLWGWFYIVIAALFFPLVLLFTKIFQKAISKSANFLSEETSEVYTFDTEYFILEQTREGMFHTTLQANYSYLFKVIEDKDAWFLYISNQQAHVVPKTDIKEGTVEELNAIFTQKLGAKFTKLK